MWQEGQGISMLMSKICKPRHGLQILDMRMVFPRPSQNVVMNSIILLNFLFNK